jgi:hypothetical protein
VIWAPSGDQSGPWTPDPAGVTLLPGSGDCLPSRSDEVITCISLASPSKHEKAIPLLTGYPAGCTNVGEGSAVRALVIRVGAVHVCGPDVLVKDDLATVRREGGVAAVRTVVSYFVVQRDGVWGLLLAGAISVHLVEAVARRSNSLVGLDDARRTGRVHPPMRAPAILPMLGFTPFQLESSAAISVRPPSTTIEAPVA